LCQWLKPHRAKPAIASGSLRDSLVALLVMLNKHHVDTALVGGLAIAARGVVRGTRDIDLLAPA